ncbi:unnamed protein product, partial [Ectocarpus sp. 12 AP-2014]
QSVEGRTKAGACGGGRSSGGSIAGYLTCVSNHSLKHPSNTRQTRHGVRASQQHAAVPDGRCFARRTPVDTIGTWLTDDSFRSSLKFPLVLFALFIVCPDVHIVGYFREKKGGTGFVMLCCVWARSHKHSGGYIDVRILMLRHI